MPHLQVTLYMRYIEPPHIHHLKNQLWCRSCTIHFINKVIARLDQLETTEQCSEILSFFVDKWRKNEGKRKNHLIDYVISPYSFLNIKCL